MSKPAEKCPGAEKQWWTEQHARDAARWRADPALPWADLDGIPVWSDGLDKVVYDATDLAEAWWEYLGEPDDPSPIDPEWALLYACKPVRFRLDAGELLNAWSEEHGSHDWDPLDGLPDEACGELQAALDAWAAKWGRDLGWIADYDQPVLPPEV